MFLFNSKKIKMKKIVLITCLTLLASCAELQQIAENLPQTENVGLGSLDFSNGLKEALTNGVEKQVTKLAKENGFYLNDKVKILFPTELQKVEDGLRKVGLSKLADEGTKMLNRAAEDAIVAAIPIVTNAITEMSIQDAKAIVLGNESAATSYLSQKTTTALTAKLQPIIKNSFAKVGADKIWNNLISKYNAIPFTQDVNSDLTDYTTQKTLEGVFSMISVEEKNIRTNISSRTSSLLQKVFATQD